MRTIALMALAISLASWTAGTTYGNASGTALEQSGAKISANTASNDSRGASVAGQEERQQVGSVSTKRPEQRRIHGKDRTRLLASTVKNHSKRAPNSPSGLPSGKAVIPERRSVSASTKTSTVASRAQSRLGVSPNAARLPPLANNSRHRGADPAVLGGATNSARKNAAINGTDLRRKP
jgi:hypothetical protein